MHLKSCLNFHPHEVQASSIAGEDRALQECNPSNPATVKHWRQLQTKLGLSLHISMLYPESEKLNLLHPQILSGNHTVEEEYPIGSGKTIDLVAAKDGKRLAIEIETGKSNALANIRKCLAAGFDEVQSIATNARVKQIIEQQVQGQEGKSENVKVLSVMDI
jgi:hypothetical protein